MTRTGNARLPAVRAGDVAASAALGLLLSVAVLAAWMFGMHAVGAGESVVMCGVPLCVVSGAGGLWWFLCVHKGWGLGDLGFVRARRPLWHLVWEAPLLMLCAAACAAAVGALVGVSPGTSDDSSAGKGLAPVAMILVIASTVCVMPVVEEVVFRRVLFGWLVSRLPAAAAVISTGLVFGACHIAPALMLYVIPWGIGITALRAWHGTLWASVIAHVVNNGVVAVAVWTALG